MPIRTRVLAAIPSHLGGAAALAGLVALGAACGGRPRAPEVLGADGGVAGASTAASQGPGLAPLEPLAPPGVRGSSRARFTVAEGAATCARAVAAASSPEATLAARVAACAEVTGGRPSEPLLQGVSGEDDPATELAVTLPAGACGRVLAAHEAGVRILGVTLLDAEGATAADGAAPAIPEEGVLCAGGEPARLVVRVAVGGGRGRWVARLVTRLNADALTSRGREGASEGRSGRRPPRRARQARQ